MTYIQKPINAGLGYNVKLINNIPKCDNEDWIIQPFLKDCDSKYSQHYRIITMYNKLYLIYNNINIYITISSILNYSN